jgi:hypothetical protein
LKTKERENQKMTYEELIAWGHANYNKGGDVFVECWEKSDFDEYCREVGPMTEEAAKQLADWYASIDW